MTEIQIQVTTEQTSYLTARPVPGYDRLYATELGQIFRQYPDGTAPTGSRWREMKPLKHMLQSEDGYRFVRVYKNGKPAVASRGALVCAAWHGPAPTTKHKARRLDGTKHNDNASNLVWALRHEVVTNG